MRIIKIETCASCPSKDHRGAFANVAYVPVCRKNDRDLPYSLGSGRRGMVMALGTNEIPEWCPLEKLEKQG